MAPHPSKEGREPLNKEKIVDKAIEIIDEVGVEGLTMRRLADALGIEPMSLYHHFANKDAILDGAIDRIVAQTSPELLEIDADADWKDIMMSGPAGARAALDAHPKASLLFLGRQYTTARSLQMLEAPLAILYSAGFRGQEIVDAAHAIFAYITGWYLLASGEGGAWSAPDREAIASAPDAAPLALSLAPQLSDWSRGFEDGLMTLLEGLEARKGGRSA